MGFLLWHQLWLTPDQQGSCSYISHLKSPGINNFFLLAEYICELRHRALWEGRSHSLEWWAPEPQWLLLCRWHFWWLFYAHCPQVAGLWRKLVRTTGTWTQTAPVRVTEGYWSWSCLLSPIKGLYTGGVAEESKFFFPCLSQKFIPGCSQTFLLVMMLQLSWTVASISVFLSYCN